MLTKVILSQIGQDLRFRFCRRILGEDPIWPWMKPREVEMILDLLERFRPRRILEWGSGYGTLYFSRACPGFETWISIEHQSEWARVMDGLNRDPRVKIVQIEAVDSRSSDLSPDLPKDGSSDAFRSYIEYPTTLEPFDLILVDGRARVACLRRAPSFLNGEGVLILHDASRAEYHPLPGDFADSLLFQDYRAEGGVWIASQNKSISELINLPHHLSVWEFYRKYGKQINFIYGPGVRSKWREVL